MPESEFRSACIMPYQNEDGEGQLHPVRICVIDLGTNSFHTVIVDAHANGAYTVLDRFKEMVRLGERGMLGHELTPEAVERSIRALRRVRQLAEGWGATEFLAYATSAVREARNGGDFIVRVREETGIDVRVINGDYEAFLIYQGVRRALEMRAPTLLVDIGGGSTEFVVATSEDIYFRASLKLGAARMTGQFISTDPVASGEFKTLRKHYRSVLAPVFAAAREHGVREVIGSSGTMENLAHVYLNHFGDSELSIYQQPFDAPSFRNVTKMIMTATREERAAMRGIDAKRVDQVVAGAMLADVLLKDLEIERLRISPNALREGMVEDFIRTNSKRLRWGAPFGDVRRRTVNELGFRFRWDLKHVHQVAALALQLFDATTSLHRLGLRERELLEYAALLHDIGYHISRSSHHKHSLYLIKQADWQGFVPEEIDIMAHVARYHRGSLPRRKHTTFQRLPAETRDVIEKLAAFLRIAEGLERSHYQNVTHIRTRLTERRFEIILSTKADPQMEIWGGRRGTDLFEKVFDRKVRLTADDHQPMTVEAAASSQLPA